jgi:hypothetical protein
VIRGEVAVVISLVDANAIRAGESAGMGEYGKFRSGEEEGSKLLYSRSIVSTMRLTLLNPLRRRECTKMVETFAPHHRDEELRSVNSVPAVFSARMRDSGVSPMVCLRRTLSATFPRMGGIVSRLARLSVRRCLSRSMAQAGRDELVRAERAGAMIARLRTLLGLPAAFVTGGYISRTILRRCLRVFRLAASRALATSLYHSLHQPPRVAGAFLI